MRYGSVCSGIEAASVAWEPLGWQPAWFSEIEAFPSAVLDHHWPSVANHGDMLKLPDLVEMGLVEAPDVLVGGTPCQSFSLAGRRGSLEAERLQGFPDNHTLVPWKSREAEKCPDGPRYKAAGNSMAVPVMAFLGSRLNQRLYHNV